jgi:hypothetical protein
MLVFLRAAEERDKVPGIPRLEQLIKVRDTLIAVSEHLSIHAIELAVPTGYGATQSLNCGFL